MDEDTQNQGGYRRHHLYHGIIIDLFSFIHQQPYTKEKVFSADTLRDLRPCQIVQWMCKKVYGVTDPAPGDQPTHGRSASLEYYKKAISFYIPNQHHPWDVHNQTGNPTRAPEVNKLIQSIKQKEVRKQGSASQARRALDISEYRKIQSLLSATRSFESKHMVPTFTKLQYNLIARLDDISRLELDDLQQHDQFPFALACKICWSKNVREERDSPRQILLGAGDKDFCALLALSVYLESRPIRSEGNFLFTDGVGEKVATQLKARVRSILDRDALKTEDFKNVNTNTRMPLGTHSFRKFPATYARLNNCTRDDVDVRGRWRPRQRVSDRYIDIEVPYADAKVAAVLCVGGAVKYALVEDSGVDDEWLAQNVVPNILRRYPRESSRVALTLALPLLWACMEPPTSVCVPLELRQRIQAAYAGLQQPNEIRNPVAKVPIVVYPVQGQLAIDEIVQDQGINVDEQPGMTVTPLQGTPLQGTPLQVNNPLVVLQTMASQLHAFRSDVRGSLTQLERNVENRFQAVSQEIRIVNRNVRRIASNPLQSLSRVAQAVEQGSPGRAPMGDPIANTDGPSQNQAPASATLSPHPRSLHVLWQEYLEGIDGRKPAKDFSSTERGAVKKLYSFRKVAWDLIKDLHRAGYSAENACDKIYESYGASLSVSAIIKRIKEDRQHGGHPNLVDCKRYISVAFKRVK
jgi:hypothetical protein